ncbi:unnamed protein product [Mucor circinelloides]
MVEVDIHCNVIRCRKPLSVESQACVTSCSHIFCVGCANTLFSKALSCPACNTSLSDSEDIILIQLNPTEEYKSSVLAGLKPEIILDICMRAVAFYEYQTSQEISFRTMIQKNVQEKYKILKDQFDIATRDLNHIIKVEKEKISAVKKDFELERLKCQQIAAKFDEKSKQFQKLQTMYEKLKRKSINPNLQNPGTSPQQQQQQQPPPLLPTMPHHQPGPGAIRSYPQSNYGRSTRSQYNNGGPADEDIMSRLGKASNITVGRSVFVPPQSPTSQSYHSRVRHGHHRPSRIPSPSTAPDNFLFSHRNYPPRRDSMDRQSQMPPTATTAEETVDFFHQRQQHEQQLQPYQHKHRRMDSTASQYYHKFVDKSRHK